MQPMIISYLVHINLYQRIVINGPWQMDKKEVPLSSQSETESNLIVYLSWKLAIRKLEVMTLCPLGRKKPDNLIIILLVSDVMSM